MRIPLATYRIQFTPGFGFRQARKIVVFLSELGISDLYASPVFRARKGSTHGYDMIDPGEINQELGTWAEFACLGKELGKEGMGWLQDIVPNHMAFDAQNPYLADVLENGPASDYFRYFDIDWEHYYEAIRGKVLAPFLGSFYGRALEAGEIRLAYGENGFSVVYYDLSFPLKIESYLDILTEGLSTLRRDLGEESPDYIQFLGVLYVLKTLRSATGNGERREQVNFVKQSLWFLYGKNRSIKKAVDAAILFFNGRPGEPESFNPLEDLLAQQWFRLAFWKLATEEINYRRFFTINDLISLKVENDEVFAMTHALPLRLLREGSFSGLRIDHIDGLYDPATYLHRLREEAPDTYLVTEKILQAGESLPPWPVQGTTGYDFMNALNGLFCDREGEKAFDRFYGAFTGQRQTYGDLVYSRKKLIIERHLFGDVNNLAHLLKNIAGRHRYGSDITMDGLKRALIEVLALFPVYRSYLDPEGGEETDRRCIEDAVCAAGEKNPNLLYELDFIDKILRLQYEEFLPQEEKPQWLGFVMRFQQLTGPLMAKGFEDTVLYVYNRLLSLNEVGGSPERFGLSVEEFHDFNRNRLARWPHALSATATHDTKRGEDVRARLNVLSEIPQEWGRQVRNWNRINQGKKRTVKRRKVPDKNDEYFLYQTLVGAFPFAKEEYPDFIARIRGYMVKSVREAKVHTAWLKPDLDYEEAFLHFVDALLTPRRGNVFLREFIPFARKVARFGMSNSLAQTLIKIAAPGIPDFYQGTEFWDLSLVDPDNRRPVDYAGRKEALKSIESGAKENLTRLIDDLLASREDGRIKLFLIHRALGLRRQHTSLFREGDYLPLDVNGINREHVIAFARQRGENFAVCVVPRFPTGLVEDGEFACGAKAWKDTTLSLPQVGSPWVNAISGRTLPGEDSLSVGEILSDFPVALLMNIR